MNRSIIKKTLILALIFTVLPSCLKDDEGWEKEQRLLRQYIAANNITVQPTASGLYYLEIEEGDGLEVEVNDILIINYTAQLLDGYVFDTSDSTIARQKNIYSESVIYGPYKFKLNRVSISGVKEGLTYMKEGGKARLIIPSKLGFGPYSYGNIPAYSTLIYDIELLEVIKDPVAHEAALLNEYLAENNITVEPESSGLYYIETEEGSGEFPLTGKSCVVRFTGKFIDGRIFANYTGDNTYTFTYNVTQLIPGFVEGVGLMKAGGMATVIIPSSLAYGGDGSQNGVIPPYSTLIYEIELLQVN